MKKSVRCKHRIGKPRRLTEWWCGKYRSYFTDKTCESCQSTGKLPNVGLPDKTNWKMAYDKCDKERYELRKTISDLQATNKRYREALSLLVEEVQFVISGGDDIHDVCPGCGCAGIGMMRDALQKARTALKEEL